MQEVIDCVTAFLVRGEGNPGAAASTSPTAVATQRDQANSSSGNGWQVDASSAIGANQREQREQYPGRVRVSRGPIWNWQCGQIWHKRCWCEGHTVTALIRQSRGSYTVCPASRHGQRQFGHQA